MIVADTSGLIALFNRAEPRHAAVVCALRAHPRAHPRARPGPLVVSPFVLAEVDHLIATRVGAAAAIGVVREFAGGAYELPALDEGDLHVIGDVMERYVDQAINVTDASIVVLADRYATRTVLTLDHRHFDVLRALDGSPFDVLP